MRSSTVATLGVVMMSAAGTVSSVKAQVIDFGAVAVGGGVSYGGATLDSSTAFDFNTSTLTVSAVGGADASGLAVSNMITVSPTDIVYGSGSSGTLSAPIMTMWTDGLGTFEETLTDVESVDRGSANAITIDLEGTITGPGFSAVPAFLMLSANQAGGPGNAIGVSFTNTAMNGESTLPPPLPAIPEPSTWATMLLGFLGLGFAGYRRARKGSAAQMAA
jgi:PEP-CTERM motif-containing protein